MLRRLGWLGLVVLLRLFFGGPAGHPLARVRAGRLRSNPLGLANSLRGFGAGVPEPLQARLNELPMPTLLIAGALDARYCQLGREMAAAIPRARLEIVPGAGHTVHLERSEAFVAALSSDGDKGKKGS